MKRLLVVAALAAAPLAPSTANACTLDTCPGTSVVCSVVNCHICYTPPEAPRHCYT